MNTDKRIFGILILALVIIVLVLFKNSPDGKVGTQPSSEPIKIGFIAALSGDAAAYGESVRDGTILALEEINKEGGVNGRQLQVIYEDGKCNGKDAATAAQKLISVDKVKIMVAGACSGEVLGYAPITNAAKVVTVSPYASNPKISDAGDYVFRNTLNDALVGKEMARLVKKDHVKAAVISENTEYAQGLRDAFKTAYTGSGGGIVADEVFPPNTKDFRSLISKVLETKPEAIFLNSQTGGGDAGMAKQLRELGSKAQFYVAYWVGPDYVGTSPAVEGTLFVDTPSVSVEGGRGGQFMTNFKNRFGKEPTYPHGAGSAYDIMHHFRDALLKYGEDGDKIKDYLYTVKNYEGVIGTYGFDEKGDLSGMSAAFRKLENGKLVDISI